MEVKSVDFFQVHRIGSHSSIWTVGNRVNWVQKRKNLFYDYYSHNGNYYNDGTGYLPFCQSIERFINSSPQIRENEYMKIIAASAKTIKDQSMFVREQIFEEVRSNYFPHLPSRQTCIWVCPSEAVEFWWNTLNNNNCKILKLKLTGSLFISDERHLIADTFRHDDFRSKAFEYWTGTDNINTQDQEILFEGIIDVVADYQNIEDFKSRTSQ